MEGTVLGAWSFHLIPSVIILALLIFSAVMVWDCLKRKKSDFNNIFGIKAGEYDKVIWIFLIVFSVKLFCIGAIAYYYLVKRA